MALNSYTTKSLRGRNAIDPMCDSQTSEDGLRRVTSRNVKRSLANHRYDSVRVHTLKNKVNGKWVVVDTGVDEKTAFNFITNVE
jgi:hypothetical protein